MHAAADRALLVVANFGAAAATVELTVDWKAAGLAKPATHFVDALTHEPLSSSEGKLTVPVGPKTFRLVTATAGQ